MTQHRRIAVAVALIACSLGGPSVAHASIITVDTTADSRANDGKCSLREAAIAVDQNAAVDSCRGGSEDDTIVLPAGTITFSIPGTNESGSRTGDLNFASAYSNSVTIKGQGMNVTTIDAAGLDRAISSGPVLKLADLTITHGHSLASGGAVAADGLEMTRVAIVDNQAGNTFFPLYGDPAPGDGADAAGTGGNAFPGYDGGGVDSNGTTTITDSVIAGNTAGPGGKGGKGTGTSSGNLSGIGGQGTGGAGGRGGNGGGLAVSLENGQSLTITGSTISGNHAGNGGNGGAGVGGTGGPGNNGNNAGTGGVGIGGGGGPAGAGGGLWVKDYGSSAGVHIVDSSLRDNTGGDGGDGGAATGGKGGNAPGFVDGAGGPAAGGQPGGGGHGGAIYADDRLDFTATNIFGNAGGEGGTGGAATGGDAGIGSTEMPGGTASGGNGLAGGSGGGIYTTHYVEAVTTTIDGNRSGVGGAAGDGTGGFDTFNSFRYPGTGGNGGSGGTGGGLFFGSTAAPSPEQQGYFEFADITDNRVGAAGAGGHGTTAGHAGSLGYAGGIYTTKQSVTLSYSIARGNDAVECVSEGPATISGAATGIGSADGSCPGTNADPQLGSLQDNGGPVLTRAPSRAGAAAGLGGDCGAGRVDARGIARTAPCDPGAYELSVPSVTTGAADGTTAHGRVNPHGPAATYHFEYGTSTAYGSATASQATGIGLADVDVSAPLSSLPAGATIHYRLVATTQDGTAYGADGTFVAPGTAATPGPAADHTAPVLKSLKLSTTKFKVGTKITITFSASEPGKYALAFDQMLAGKKVKKKGKTTCVKAHGKVPKKSRCDVLKSLGSLNGTAKAGANKVTFAGKLGKKKLARGSYKMTLKTTDSAGNKSKAATATFTVK